MERIDQTQNQEVTMSRSPGALIGAFVLQVVTSSAMATPPQSEQFIDFGFGALAPIDCGNFILSYELSGERARITTFFDKNGAPYQTRIRWVIHGALTHSATGQTLRDQSVLNITTDLNSGSLTVVGVGFHYAIPGKGLIFLDAGRFIVATDGSIEFEAGPKVGSSFEKLCAALAI